MRFLALVLIFFAFNFSAQAANVAVPVLRPGQFVYTVPSSFEFPLIGKAGMEAIEKEADRLHYPFYVIFVQELSATTDEEVGDAIDTMAEQLQSKQSELFSKYSQLLVVSYKPKKFGLKTGSEFRSRQIIDKDGGGQFLQPLIAKANLKPPDLKNGIVDMMVPLDNALFAKTDTAHLATTQVAVEAQQPKQESTSMVTMIILGVGFVLIMLVSYKGRKKYHSELRKKYDQRREILWRVLSSSKEQYAELVAKLETLDALYEMGGGTMVLLKQLFGVNDQFHLNLEALESRIISADALADAATPWVLGDLLTATTMLEESFEFNLREASGDHSSLGSVNTYITVAPASFKEDQHLLYTQGIGYLHVLAAADAERFITVIDALETPVVIEFKQHLAGDPLKKAWLKGYPLSDGSLKATLSELEALQKEDPVAFMNRKNELIKDARDYQVSVEGLEDVLGSLAQERIPQTEADIDTVFDNEAAHPRAQLKAIEEADTKLMTELATSHTPFTYFDKVQRLRQQYLDCRGQIRRLTDVIKNLPLLDHNAELQLQKTNEMRQKALMRAKEADKVHTGFTAKNEVQIIDKKVADAKAKLPIARSLAHKRQHTKAKELFDAAAASLGSAERQYQDIIMQCLRQDEKKHKYEAELAKARDTQRDVNARLKKARSSQRVEVDEYRPSSSSGPTDYDRMTAYLHQQSTQWEQEATKVEHSARVETATPNWSSSGHTTTTHDYGHQSKSDVSVGSWSSDTSSNSDTGGSSGGDGGGGGGGGD